MSNYLIRQIEEYFRKGVIDIREMHSSFGVEVMFSDRSRIVLDREFLHYIERKGGQYQKQMSTKFYSDGRFQQAYYQITPEMWKDHSYSFTVGNDWVENYPKCQSCGDKHSRETLDYHGFCKKNQSKFWTKVKKLYWHRYLKNHEQEIRS